MNDENERRVIQSHTPSWTVFTLYQILSAVIAYKVVCPIGCRYVAENYLSNYDDDELVGALKVLYGGAPATALGYGLLSSLLVEVLRIPVLRRFDQWLQHKEYDVWLQSVTFVQKQWRTLRGLPEPVAYGGIASSVDASSTAREDNWDNSVTTLVKLVPLRLKHYAESGVAMFAVMGYVFMLGTLQGQDLTEPTAASSVWHMALLLGLWQTISAWAAHRSDQRAGGIIRFGVLASGPAGVVGDTLLHEDKTAAYRPLDAIAPNDSDVVVFDPLAALDCSS